MDELTPGEVAANLLGARGVTCLLCAWLDESGRWTWYKIGSSVTVIGLMDVLKARYLEECAEEEDE
jgi:hypothetical protein